MSRQLLPTLVLLPSLLGSCLMEEQRGPWKRVEVFQAAYIVRDSLFLRIRRTFEHRTVGMDGESRLLGVHWDFLDTRGRQVDSLSRTFTTDIPRIVLIASSGLYTVPELDLGWPAHEMRVFDVGSKVERRLKTRHQELQYVDSAGRFLHWGDGRITSAQDGIGRFGGDSARPRFRWLIDDPEKEASYALRQEEDSSWTHVRVSLASGAFATLATYPRGVTFRALPNFGTVPELEGKLLNPGEGGDWAPIAAFLEEVLPEAQAIQVHSRLYLTRDPDHQCRLHGAGPVEFDCL